MSKDDDFTNGAGEDLKKDFKNIFKHSKRAIKGFFRGGSRRNNCGRRPNGCPPFFLCRSPLLMLLYPKLIVAWNNTFNIIILWSKFIWSNNNNFININIYFNIGIYIEININN